MEVWWTGLGNKDAPCLVSMTLNSDIKKNFLEG